MRTIARRCWRLPASAWLAPGEEPGTDEEVVEAFEVPCCNCAPTSTPWTTTAKRPCTGAAYRNAPAAAAFLAARGADIKTWNRPNRYGWTPLLIAEG